MDNHVMVEPGAIMGNVAKSANSLGFFLFPSELPLDPRVRLLAIQSERRAAPRLPDSESLALGSHELADTLALYVNSDAAPVAHRFCEFATGPEGAKILKQHGLWPEYELKKVRAELRLKEMQAGKGTPVAVCGLAGREDFVNALAIEYVKAKALVQVKYEGRATAEEAEAAFGEKGELLIEEVGSGQWAVGGEKKQLTTDHGLRTTYPLGHRAVGVIVHRDSAVKELTLDDLRGIYSGQIDTWPGASGKDAKMRLYGLGPETVTMRVLAQVVSGPLSVVRGKAEGGGQKAESGRHARITQRDDTAKVVQAVAGEPGALGFVDLAAMPAKESSVKLVAILAEGVASGEGRVKTPHSPPTTRHSPLTRWRSRSRSRSTRVRATWPRTLPPSSPPTGRRCGSRSGPAASCRRSKWVVGSRQWAVRGAEERGQRAEERERKAQGRGQRGLARWRWGSLTRTRAQGRWQRAEGRRQRTPPSPPAPLPTGEGSRGRRRRTRRNPARRTRRPLRPAIRRRATCKAHPTRGWSSVRSSLRQPQHWAFSRSVSLGGRAPFRVARAKSRRKRRHGRFASLPSRMGPTYILSCRAKAPGRNRPRATNGTFRPPTGDWRTAMKLQGTPFDLSGRVALVTGGSKGIGRAIAEGFAAAGADLFLCARREGPLGEAAEAMRRRFGVHVEWLAADMARRADVDSAAKTAVEKLGRVDILVNNAGWNVPQAIDEVRDEDWNYLVELNLTSVMALTRAVVPQMKDRRWGRVIHISSVMALGSTAKRNAYSATKAALIGLCRASALDLGRHGITVNCIAPGPIATEMPMSILSKEQQDSFAARTAVNRWGTPEEVAGAALLLASEAGSYITGTCLVVDGGLTANVF